MSPLGIESHVRLVFIAWAVIVVIALSFGHIARRLGQPSAVGEMAAGLALGPSLLGALWPAGMEAVFPAAIHPSLHLLAKVGVVLFMFQVGMAFDFGHLRGGSRRVLAISMCGMAVPTLLALAAGSWLYDHHGEGAPELGFRLFLCVALSITALPVLAHLLLERRLERTRLGVMAISCAAIDDAAGWILLAAITAIVTSGFEPVRVGLQLAGLGAFTFLVLFAAGPLLVAWWRRARTDRGLDGPFLAGLIAALLLSCAATNALGVFSLPGAFLLGVALHRESSLVDAWRSSVAPVATVSLVPLFFATTGLRTHAGTFDRTAWLGFAVVLLLAVAGKLGGCHVAARWSGLPAREAASVGAMMNTRGLMGLVALGVGRDLGVIGPRMFTIMVLMALVTTAMTGPLLDLLQPAVPAGDADDTLPRPAPAASA